MIAAWQLFIMQLNIFQIKKKWDMWSIWEDCHDNHSNLFMLNMLVFTRHPKWCSTVLTGHYTRKYRQFSQRLHSAHPLNRFTDSVLNKRLDWLSAKYSRWCECKWIQWWYDVKFTWPGSQGSIHGVAIARGASTESPQPGKHPQSRHSPWSIHRVAIAREASTESP